MTGVNTSFSQGVTTVTTGAGITVGAVTVSNSTTLAVQLVIDPAAVPGPRSITAVTGTGEATLPNAFLVAAQ